MPRKKSFIRPGLNVDCVVKVNDKKRVIDVRRGQVYDLGENIIVISQTIPEIPASYKGQRIAVTWVSHEDSRRIGLSGNIDRIVSNYPLSPSEKVGAIFLSDLSEERQHNLRFAFRVKPPAGFDLTMYNSYKESLKIVDISAMGARFSHDMTRVYSVGHQIKIYIGYEQVFYELKALVVRKEPFYEKNRQIEYVAVQFIDLNYRIEEELYRIVRRIEFQQTSHHLLK